MAALTDATPHDLCAEMNEVCTCRAGGRPPCDSIQDLHDLGRTAAQERARMARDEYPPIRTHANAPQGKES